jgi:hypothetical protein
MENPPSFPHSLFKNIRFRIDTSLSKQLVLQSHVRLWVKTETSAEDVCESSALLGKSIDDRSARWRKWSLEHVAEDAQNAVEATIVAGLGLPLDTSHHFSNEDEVDDQWRGEERIFADVEQRDGLVATKENLCVVLVESTLVITDSWHVLDDDTVVWVFTLLVKHSVGSDHVVNHVRLGDLLGAELLLGAQVLAVVVAKVVVTGNGRELDTSVDEEVNKSGLHLGLSRFEVITTDESLVLLSKLDSTWNEGVLRGTVNEWCILKD